MTDISETDKDEDVNISTSASQSICITPNCGKIAILSCPTCLKLGKYWILNVVLIN